MLWGVQMCKIVLNASNGLAKESIFRNLLGIYLIFLNNWALI